MKLDSIQYVTHDHDVGFQLNCSYGNGLRLTGNEDYRKVLYQGAKSLATRFNPLTGVIRSWDFVPKTRDWKYPVIIDNMMNLELLMFASNTFGNDSLGYIARTHADTTMKNHLEMIILLTIWLIMTRLTDMYVIDKLYRDMRMNLLGGVGRHGLYMAIL